MAKTLIWNKRIRERRFNRRQTIDLHAVRRRKKKIITPDRACNSPNRSLSWSDTSKQGPTIMVNFPRAKKTKIAPLSFPLWRRTVASWLMNRAFVEPPICYADAFSDAFQVNFCFFFFSRQATTVKCSVPISRSIPACPHYGVIHTCRHGYRSHEMGIQVNLYQFFF